MTTYPTVSARKALVIMVFTAVLPLCPTTGVAVEFGNAASYPVGTAPAAVVVADFNRDGKPDLAVANCGSGNISILLNNGDGTYKPAVNFDAGIASPTSIEVADFNNDGIQDIAVWSLTGPIGSSLSILLGNGDGTFQAPRTTPLPAAADQATLALLAADFNLDHIPDLALLVADANGAISRIFLLAGNGDGTFQPPQPASDALSTPAGAVFTADFNNDGKPDLAAGSQILLGRGDGSFQTAGTVDGEISWAGDFNGDGKVDLIEGFKTSCPEHTPCIASEASLFFGNGDGSFQGVKVVGAGGDRVIVGDFNGDGMLDILNSRDGISFGQGYRPPSAWVPFEGSNLIPCCTNVMASDLNGDKLSDLIYLDHDKNAAVVILNTTPTIISDSEASGNSGGGGGAVGLVELLWISGFALWRALSAMKPSSLRRLGFLAVVISCLRVVHRSPSLPSQSPLALTV